MKRIWQEIHQQGNAKVRRWAQYTEEGLHIVCDYDDEQDENMTVVQRSPVIIGEKFTLQALIHFYPTALSNDVWIEFDTSPDETIVWQLTANNGQLWGRGYDQSSMETESWNMVVPKVKTV